MKPKCAVPHEYFYIPKKFDSHIFINFSYICDILSLNINAMQKSIKNINASDLSGRVKLHRPPFWFKFSKKCLVKVSRNVIIEMP